jgi:hypothetical protein
MKILHVVQEREAKMVPARVLHGIAQNVTLTWVPTPASAVRWLQDNRDAAAVVVEVQAQGCSSFVGELRELGLMTPVVVVAASARLEPALAALNSGAEGYVVAGASLEADLSRTLTAAIDRERSRRQLLRDTLTDLAAARDRAEQQLARVEEARREIEQRSGSELAAAAARLADVEAGHAASLAREARICTTLQHRLFELESAVRQADERRASEAAVFADQFAKRHAEFTASLAQAAQSRDALVAEAEAAMAALEDARQARRADAAAANEMLRRREAELGAALADALTAKTASEKALAESEAANEHILQRAAADRAEALERQAALEDLLAQEADQRTNLDRQLTAAEDQRRDADKRHLAELTKTATALAELQTRYDAAQEVNAAAHAAFDRQWAEAAAVLERANQERSAEAAAAAAHLASVEADLGARLDVAVGERVALEHALNDALAAQRYAAERAQIDAAAAAARQTALEQDLSAARKESARGRSRLLHVASAYRQRNSEQRAQLDLQRREREALRHELAANKDELRRLSGTLEHERQSHEQHRLTSESELQRVSAEYAQSRQSFDRLQSAFQTLEQVAGEHAAERTRLEAVVADRDSRLSAQAERHRVSEQNAQDALARLQETLQRTLDANAAEAVRHSHEADALRRELDASRVRAEALRAVADRVPDLQAELERSQNERRRQFERSPYPLCRCSQTGAIIDANHSFVSLLGFRRADELRNMDFVAAVHDSAGDMSWLLERARTTRVTETVETQWKTRGGRRLVVRLQALATAAGLIEIVAEDVTGVRGLEERVRQAERMESVGRLASEVAVTCNTLLGDVARDAHEWRAGAGSDEAARRHAERLLTDVTRAASFLRQLATYGQEQARALEPVSAGRVLRDLAPVLKRLVGDRISLVLPKSAGSFNVDVDGERLERVLINVAAYARERMTTGGQVKIDLGTAAVGHRFVARYPNVRPGDHVLITVTELPNTAELRVVPRSVERADKPGVDLGVLVDLVATCGGHLWVEAQPAGNMVVKIHLPKPAVADGREDSRREAPASRGGRLARWFRSSPGVNVRA